MNQEVAPELQEVLYLLDKIRQPLLDLKFTLPSVAYNRKKLEEAHSLQTTVAFLKKMDKLIVTFQTSPLFPGFKSIRDYDLLGITKTPEQLAYKARKVAVIEAWKNRPDLLRKVNRAKPKPKS